MAWKWALLALMIGIGLPAAAMPLKTYDEVVAALPRGDAEGQVLDAKGTPAAGAEVFLYYEAGFWGHYRDRLAGRVKTDEQGRFKFEKAIVWEPPTAESHRRAKPKYDLIARHPALGMGCSYFKIEDPTKGMKITLEKMRPYILSVKDAQGKPLEGASLYLNSICSRFKPIITPSTEVSENLLWFWNDIGLTSGTAGKDGKATLEALPGASFAAVKAGYCKAVSDGAFTLRPTLTVEGRVLDPGMNPVAGIPVWMNCFGSLGNFREVSVTDGEGRYAFSGVPAPGNSPAGSEAGGTVELEPEDNRLGSRAVGQSIVLPVKAGEKNTRDLALMPGVRLAGRVIDETTHQPIARMRLSCTDGNSREFPRLTADEQGRFETKIPEKSQVSILIKPSYTGDYILDREQDSREVFSGQLNQDTTGVEIRARVWPVATLRGRVLDAHGKPATNVSIYLHSDVPPLQSDPDGSFTLTLAPTDRDFDLLALDGKKAAALIHCKAGTREAILKLAPLRDYAGKAVTTAGRPADNLQFRLCPVLNSTTLSGLTWEVRTDGEGAFQAQGLIPEMTYQASWSVGNAQNRDYASDTTQICLAGLKAGEPITFNAEKYNNTLTVKVLDIVSKPVEGATITMEPDYLPARDVRRGSYTTDKNGNLTIMRMAAGKVQLRVYHPSYGPRMVVTASDNANLLVRMNSQWDSPVTFFVVVDEQDKPVKEAAVQIIIRPHDRSLAQGQGFMNPNVTLKTDERGIAEYRADEPSGGAENMINDQGGLVWLNNGLFRCDAKGYDLAFGELDGLFHEERLVHLTHSGKNYRGQVVNEQHNPIDGALVELTRWAWQGSAAIGGLTESDTRLGINAVTDKDGHFVLPRINPECDLGCVVSAKGYARSAQSVLARNMNRGVIVLSRPALLEGKVVDKETGKPVGGGEVSAFNTRQGGSTQAMVDAGGNFRLEGIPAGDYFLWLQMVSPSRSGSMPKDYIQEEPYPVTVTAGKPASVTLAVMEAMPVQGKLVDPKTGKAPKGSYALGVCRADDNNQRTSTYSVQDDGQWFCKLPAGTYQLSVEPRAGGRILAQEPDKPTKTIKVEKGKRYNDIVIEIPPEPQK